MLGDELGILFWIAATTLEICKALLMVTVMDTRDWVLSRLTNIADPFYS